MSWLPWVVGVVVLVGAGFGAVYVPRVRAREVERRTAWSAARAAIGAAAVSRDAVSRVVPAADELFARAESLSAHGGGVGAADDATDCAERADRLWREAAGE